MGTKFNAEVAEERRDRRGDSPSAAMRGSTPGALRRVLTFLPFSASSALLCVLCVTLLAGCRDPRPATQPDPKLAAVEAEAAKNPSVLGLFDTWLKLGKDLRDQLLAYGQRLERRQDLQNSARTWLIAGAIVFGIFSLATGAGKFLAGKAAGATPWGLPLVWVSEKVSGWSIVWAAAACAACICAAIWIGPLWALGIKALCIAGGAGIFWAGWATSALRHTGPWKPDGLVRLPKGWQAAKE